MATTTELTVKRRRSPLVAMPTAEDRAVAFRRATRHSRLVRILRVGLPVTAVALFATYGISMKMTITDSTGGTLSVSIPTIIGEDLTMNNPEYQGYNKDGSRYIVRAETARQDIRQTGPVRLDVIRANLTQPDSTVTVLNGRRGDFETKSGVLRLFDGIDIASQSGMKAQLSTATVQTKEGLVTSNEPVLVTMPTGQLRGNRMEMRQKSREVTFLDGVTARLVPEEKPAGQAPVQPAASGQTPAILTASNQPVDVVSERLDVDDNKKIATFRGSVKAVQGDATLVAPELEVHYEQPPGQAQPAAAAAPQGRLNKLVARTDITLTRGSDVVTAREAIFEAAANRAYLLGGVVINSPPDRRATGERAEIDTATNQIRLAGSVVLAAGDDRRATADVADIDQKADVAVLTGQSVVVTQGQNVLKGLRLSIDRKAGTSEMIAPGSRVEAHFVRPQTDQRKQATPSAPALAIGGASFATDPNAPIDLESDNLVINDNAKTATFRGDVRVVQGEFVVRTPELVASYTGQASLADQQPAPKGKRAAGEGEGTQLQTLRANRKVLITSQDNQSVTGDWALFDVKGNIVTVGGDVVLTQGRNVIRGPKLVIDMVTGQSRMEQVGGVASAGGEGNAQSNAKAIGEGACGGRMCAVFYPKELKEIQEKQRSEQQQGATRKAAPAAPPASSGSATSGWSTDTDRASRSN
jgi:LPS export ABC transporter protein LptC